jgi:hypothetical protein
MRFKRKKYDPKADNTVEQFKAFKTWCQQHKIIAKLTSGIENDAQIIMNGKKYLVELDQRPDHYWGRYDLYNVLSKKVFEYDFNYIATFHESYKRFWMTTMAYLRTCTSKQEDNEEVIGEWITKVPRNSKRVRHWRLTKRGIWIPYNPLTI